MSVCVCAGDKGIKHVSVRRGQRNECVCVQGTKE